jgi:hypothetical protein
MTALRTKLLRARGVSSLILCAGACAIAIACKSPSDTSTPGQSGGSAQGGTAGGSSQLGGTSGAGGSMGGKGGSGNNGGSVGGSQASGGGGVSGAGGKGASGGDAGASGGAAGSTACTSSQTSCWGACSDLQSDPKNCGKCGTVCASGTCNAGACKKAKDCYAKTTITDSLVADFEGYDGKTAAADWGWAFNGTAGSSKAVYAGLYEYDDGTGSPAVSIAGPGNASSKYAGKLATGGQSSKWGGALGMWMGCVDASAYKGVSFWVKGNAPKLSGTLGLATETTSPPDSKDPAGGGTCTTGTCQGPTVDFPVSTGWSQVIAKWADFTDGTANGATVKTTGGNVTGMTWQVGLAFKWNGDDAGSTPIASAYDIEVDDIRFIDDSVSCPNGRQLCGTSCVDTGSDSANCGSCANACAKERACSGGKCVCPTGYTDCDGQCVDPQIDAQNCGGCGKSCTGECSGGSCKDSTCAASLPKKDTKTAKGDSIDLGKYWINNNWWGNSNATGTQSIWDTCSSGNTIGWGTSWNWTGGSGVITYASAVLGWHYGWHFSNTGLPVQLSDGKTITCGWHYSVQPGKVMNVSYDLFAHTQSNPTASDNPSDEIMIWLYRAGGATPIGSTSATVTIGGSSWELHEGSNGSWNVHSYLRSSNADTGATLNISDFLNDLTGNRGMAKTKYLTSIQAGTEVTQGTGELDTDQYYCTIK